jgi:hypothetical protein
MDATKKRQVSQLVEASLHTDNSESESEKTAVIAELLAEVERLEQEYQPR